MAYTGLLANLVVGINGINGTESRATFDPNDLLLAQSITYEDGTLKKEGGASKYNSIKLGAAVDEGPLLQEDGTAILLELDTDGTSMLLNTIAVAAFDVDILAGWDWFPSEGTQRMIILTDQGLLLKDTGDAAFSVELKTGLTVSDVVPMFVEGGAEVAANDRKLFCFTGKNAVQVLDADGSSTGDLATPPSDWSSSNQPSWGFIHANRMLAGGNLNDPHRVYYSTTTNHEDFTSPGSGSFQIYPGEGEKLIAGTSFKGIAVLWKFPEGLYGITTPGPDFIRDSNIQRFNANIGTVSPRSYCHIQDDVVFIDRSGSFHLLSATDRFGNLGTGNLSDQRDMDPFMRDLISFSQLDNTKLVYYNAKRQVHASLGRSGSSNNDLRVLIDFNRSGIARFSTSTRDIANSIWMRKDSTGVPRLTIGDDTGYVWNLDQDTRTVDGAGYEAKFQTPHDDFSQLDPRFATIQKNLEYLEIVVESTGNHTLNVDVLLDGQVSQTVSFNLGSTGATLDSFVLDTSQLGEIEVLNRKKLLTGAGRRVSFVGKQSGVGENFSIANFIVGFKPGSTAIS
jgi:hypothetical protein